MRTVRALVVDDSALARALLLRILGEDPLIEVVGVAHGGAQAVDMAAALDPDIVVMDIEMPDMDGLRATSAIMSRCPCPILLVTGNTDNLEGRRALDGLARGALDIVAKPPVDGSEDGLEQARVLRRKLRLLAGLKPLQEAGRRRALAAAARPAGVLVGLVASTGGPSALATVLERLRPELDLSVVIVQHISNGFDTDLLRALQVRSQLPVRTARDGDVATAGSALVAPGGRHMRVSTLGRIALSDGPPVQHLRPSGDLLLESLAAWRSKGIGVVLTGMGRDGAIGLGAVSRAGGFTIAQDEATSTVYGMPRAALEMCAVDAVLPIEAVAERIMAVAAEVAAR